MSSTGGAQERGYDPDATMLLPIVPAGGYGSAEQTMLMPLMSPYVTNATWHVPMRAPTGVWTDPDPTALLPIVPAGATVPVTEPRHRRRAVGTARVPATGTAPVPRTAARAPGTPDLTAPPTEAPTPDLTGEQPSVVRSSAVMAAGSMVSRVTGLLRTVTVGAALGAGIIGNDYNLSNTLPNMVYELLLGGVMSSVLVPFLMRARLKEADRGEAYAQRLLTMAVVLLGSATVVAVAAAPLLTKVFTATARNPRPTAADIHLITTLSYLILPEIFFYGMAALIAAILNTRGHFAAPTWTPILNNVVVIATAAFYMILPSADIVTPANISSAQVLVLGIGTTLGILAQAAGLVPALRSVGFRWKWRFDWRELQLRTLGKASGWMLWYVVMSQTGLIVLLVLLTGASARVLDDGTHAPGISIYNASFLIFMMAHGIVAVSIMTALMPRMSAAAAQGRFGDLANHFSQGTRLSSVILIPAATGYVVLGQPLAVTLFQWGEFTHTQAVQTGTVIAVTALGLVPFAITQMQLFAFYSMQDTRTPAIMNMPVIATRVAFDVLFYLVLPYALVTAGLMLANTISYVLAMIIGYTLLRKRIGRLGLTETAVALSRLAIAAVAAELPAWGVVTVIGRTMGTGKTGSLVALAAGGLVLVIGYVLASFAIRARDVTAVAAMVRARFGR